MRIALHINVDHVATLRQARGTPYPDPVEAARHEAVLSHVEDLRAKVAVPSSLNEGAKKIAREQMAATTVPTWASYVEATEASYADQAEEVWPGVF